MYSTYIQLFCYYSDRPRYLNVRHGSHKISKSFRPLVMYRVATTYNHLCMSLTMCWQDMISWVKE